MMQLIVISSADYIAGEADLINRLFHAGLSCFHLRKPGSDARQLCNLLKDIEPAFYKRIALHQHHEIISDYGIMRLHYPEQIRQQMLPDDLKSNSEKGYILSTSLHDFKMLNTLTAFDYAFLGPVFNSLSKPGYLSTFGSELKITEAPEGSSIIALGGITPDCLVAVKEMGFHGAAVLGVIWNHPQHATRTFKELQNTITELTNHQI